ncbi:MAG: gliding motility-associated C-terminal domain-containing protein, partial [Cyclobacteriaceae bacterium]|nr:gliding motility-associated C-terminal domain-containing protein [Cyclobacteriaceae bacterium]
MNGQAIVSTMKNPVPPISITGSPSACQGVSNMVYSVTPTPGDQYKWILPEGMKLLNGQDSSQIVLSVAPTAKSGTLSVSAYNACGTSAAAGLFITVEPAVKARVVFDSVVFEGKETVFSLETTSSLDSITWTFMHDQKQYGLSVTTIFESVGVYHVSADIVSTGGCRLFLEEFVTVKLFEPLRIHNVVTPNNDGKNDVLYIENITYFPGNRVVILDRWGIKIREFTDYQNDWIMDTERGDTIPPGNYICIVKMADGEVFSRTVTVIY